MKGILTILILVIPFLSISQEKTIKNYAYKFTSTDLSPKQAIQKAVKEALSKCVQENMGVQVMNLTSLSKQEHNKKYDEKFSEFTQIISNGFVRDFRIKDTITSFNPANYMLETTLVMDIIIYQPGDEDELGLHASCNRSSYLNNETAHLTLSVKQPAYVYILDLAYNSKFCLLHESKESVQADKTITFPAAGNNFTLSMVKENQEEFEFGSFVVVASEKKINFGVQPADGNYCDNCFIDFKTFFNILSNFKKSHSITYLPYCIE